MTVPAPLIEFFQQEASEYLERLEQLLGSAKDTPPGSAAFVAQARALRGSAMMTRLDGLTELCSTVERIANGVRSGELRWDQRLLFAVHGALVEIRALVARASSWGEAEQRRSRTQSVALAAVAAGYLAGGPLPSMSPASAVVPVSRLLMDDGEPAIVYRNPLPAITIAQRFRGDIAAAADGVAREAANLATTAPGGAQLAVSDGVRRALLGLADAADSYGATSISTLATRMARSALDRTEVGTAVQAFARMLMDREVSDQELAAQVKSASASWNHRFGTPVAGPTVRTPSAASTPLRATPAGGAPLGATALRATAVGGALPGVTPHRATPPYVPAREVPQPATSSGANTGEKVAHGATVVPVSDLLYRGRSALDAALAVRDRLGAILDHDSGSSQEVRTLFLELSDLLDLAAGNEPTSDKTTL